MTDKIPDDVVERLLADTFVLSDAREADGLIRELVEALEIFQSYGCPVCGGDCASANPPVMMCPMRTAHDAIANAIRALKNK